MVRDADGSRRLVHSSKSKASPVLGAMTRLDGHAVSLSADRWLKYLGCSSVPTGFVTTNASETNAPCSGSGTPASAEHQPRFTPRPPTRPAVGARPMWPAKSTAFGEEGAGGLFR